MEKIINIEIIENIFYIICFILGSIIFIYIGYNKYKELKSSNKIIKTNLLFSLKRQYENKSEIKRFGDKDLIIKNILKYSKYAYLSRCQGLIDFVEKIKNKEDDILFSGKECRKLKKGEKNGFTCSSFKIDKLFKKLFKNVR